VRAHAAHRYFETVIVRGPTIRLSPLRKATVEQVLLIFAAWTFLAVFSVAQNIVYFTQSNKPIPWRDMLTGRFADWYTCALFTPLFFWLARRYPIDRRTWRTALPLTLAVTSVCVVVKYALFAPLVRALGLGDDATFGSLVSRSFASESMAFWAVIGIIHAFEFNRRYQERELTAAYLRTQLSEVQLEALRSQIHPHFLFNTLHSISTLMHRDVDAADTMLTRLSDLLRLTLKHRGENEIALREELSLADNYCAIMSIRFGDRLTIARRIDPGALDSLVPQFVLQPLLENALQHGVATTSGPARIDISAEAVDGKLRLAVTDNGRGAPSAVRSERPGMGLSNTRLRLEQLYGRNQSLVLEKLPERGTRITVELPLRTAATASSVAAPSVA
jgi:two-component system LytT family sensor kinase